MKRASAWLLVSHHAKRLICDLKSFLKLTGWRISAVQSCFRNLKRGSQPIEITGKNHFCDAASKPLALGGSTLK
jgi:hypothetical protein